MDAQLFLSLNHLGPPALDDLMWIISELGKGEFAAAITIILVGVAHRGLKLIPTVMILLALGGAGVTSSVIKDWVYRPRPFTTLQSEVRVVGEELRQRSFPSGHAASAFSLCVAACLPLQRRRAWLLGLVLASLVAFSRIHVGAHYPGDVMAGAMLGALWGIGAAKLQALLEQRSKPQPA